MSEVLYQNLLFLGFPDYEVGTDGSVWSLKYNKRKRLADRPDSHGHLMVALSHNGVRSNFFVAHLVLLSFVGPRPKGMEACHGDGVPQNNSPTNLRWGTHKSNMEDRSKHGKTARNLGESNGSAVLTDQEAVRVLQRRKQGIKYRQLMIEFGVSFNTIRRICSRRSYRHLQT